MWTILGTQDESSAFDAHVRTILTRERHPLPPRSQRIGHVEVRWEQVGRKSAFIQAAGGSHADRLLARTMVAEQLRSHGYRQASWSFDEFRKTADWNDLMTKAKRLIQSGKVRLLRNGYNNVVGQVQGDHGTYEPEIFRDDPSSRAITGSFCDCDWGEFQNQPRTRQWKKFQDRPCSHILALYWTALATPLDEDVNPAAPAPGGAGPGTQMSLFQSQPQTAPETEMGEPSAAGPGGAFTGMPGLQQPQMTDEGMMLPQQPGAAGAGPADVLPQFPMEGLAQGQIQPASIPGARGPTPTSPVSYPLGPGGAFSSVRQADEAFTGDLPGFVNGDLVQLRYDDTGTLVGRSEAHGAGQEATLKAGQVGEVLGTDPTTGMVNVLYMGSPWDGNGPMQPYGATGWHFPSYLVARKDLRQPGPAIRRR